VVGGYVVTGRMLKMFRRRAVPSSAGPASANGQGPAAPARREGGAAS
jgi:hypothetical protein